MQASNSIRKNRRKTFLFVGVVITLVLVVMAVVTFTNAYTASEHDYAKKTESMRTGVEDATKGLLGPMGGIERQNATGNPG